MIRNPLPPPFTHVERGRQSARNHGRFPARPQPLNTIANGSLFGLLARMTERNPQVFAGHEVARIVLLRFLAEFHKADDSRGYFCGIPRDCQSPEPLAGHPLRTIAPNRAAADQENNCSRPLTSLYNYG